MRVGFIGLGNVGGKLASSLLRNGFELMVHDLQRAAAGPLLEGGAKSGNNGAEVLRYSDIYSRFCCYCLSLLGLRHPIAGRAVLSIALV